MIDETRVKPPRSHTPEAPAPITDAVDLSLRLLERLARAQQPIGISDLARELGSSKATIYRRWSTKEAMVLDALRAAMSPIEDVDTEWWRQYRHRLEEELEQQRVLARLHQVTVL